MCLCLCTVHTRVRAPTQVRKKLYGPHNPPTQPKKKSSKSPFSLHIAKQKQGVHGPQVQNPPYFVRSTNTKNTAHILHENHLSGEGTYLGEGGRKVNLPWCIYYMSFICVLAIENPETQLEQVFTIPQQLSIPFACLGLQQVPVTAILRYYVYSPMYPKCRQVDLSLSLRHRTQRNENRNEKKN